MWSQRGAFHAEALMEVGALGPMLGTMGLAPPTLGIFFVNPAGAVQAAAWEPSRPWGGPMDDLMPGAPHAP